jgi:hypothetical protein
MQGWLAVRGAVSVRRKKWACIQHSNTFAAGTRANCLRRPATAQAKVLLLAAVMRRRAVRRPRGRPAAGLERAGQQAHGGDGAGALAGTGGAVGSAEGWLQRCSPCPLWAALARCACCHTPPPWPAACCAGVALCARLRAAVGGASGREQQRWGRVQQRGLAAHVPAGRAARRSRHGAHMVCSASTMVPLMHCFFVV